MKQRLPSEEAAPSGHLFSRPASSGRSLTKPVVWSFVLAVMVLLGTPAEALAWGPMTHVGLGGSVMEGLALLPAAVAAILARHRISYLYGCIATDIVFAKRLSRVKQFCHHWSTGFRLLDTAANDKSKAFAYGYLSHLAADTVAHGKYVPHQITLSGASVGFGHFYWELRADAAEPAGVQTLFENVLDKDHTPHHRELACHIHDTFLSYDLNRLLFDRMNALAAHHGFRRTVDVWSRCSRWNLSSALLADYHDESLDRILSVLSEGDRSAVLKEDPNGTSALMQLRVRRRELRRLRRRGMPIAGRLRETSQAFAPGAPR